MIKLRERTLYITPDDIRFELEVPPKRAILSREGEGMPPIEYITQRGPFQHGVSLKDYFLQPRNLQYIIRHNYCNRDSYWEGRANLLNHVRPNRQIDASGLCAFGSTQGRIRKYFPDGAVRDINVMIAQGPGFVPVPTGTWDQFGYTEALRFIAFNPIWYDPVARSQLVSSTETSFPYTFPIDLIGTELNLVFPITFPIVFGAISQSFDVTYPGTWLSFPTFVITGAFTAVIINNVTTDELIQLDYNAADGETITICLEYGTKSITNDAGDNLIGFLSDDTDLGTFHIAPDPEATDGVNSFTVEAVGVGANTTITMYWYHRYIGV